MMLAATLRSFLSHEKTAVRTAQALFLLVLLWPPLMILSQPPGDLPSQLEQLADRFWLYRLNFMLASLIAPCVILWLLSSFRTTAGPRSTPRLDTWGTILLLPYFLLASLAYGSQYTLLPLRLAAGMPAGARDWYFNDPESIPYFLNQLGYVFFGLAALLLAAKLFQGQPLERLIGALLYLSALLSFIAFVGLLASVEVLSAATLVSGGLILPASFLSIFWKRKKDASLQES